MITVSGENDTAAWRRLWEQAESEFFKVESMPDYSNGEQHEQQESLQLWLQGDKAAALEIMRDHAEDWAEPSASKNIAKIRVHIVPEPLTPYLEWEIAHYAMINIPLGGEQVYLVHDKDVPGYNLGDFMMFDETKVLARRYNDAGKPGLADVYEDESVEQFRVAKAMLMSRAQRLHVS